MYPIFRLPPKPELSQKTKKSELLLRSNCSNNARHLFARSAVSERIFGLWITVTPLLFQPVTIFRHSNLNIVHGARIVRIYPKGPFDSRTRERRESFGARSDENSKYYSKHTVTRRRALSLACSDFTRFVLI